LAWLGDYARKGNKALSGELNEKSYPLWIAFPY